MADQELDIELILALAEGTLSESEAAAAEAALGDSARAELALQRFALEAMRDVPEPMLAASERAHLRATVREAINLAPAPAPVRAPVRAPWYARAFPALAGLAALVVVVGVGLNLGGGDDAGTGAPDSVSETTAAALSQQTGSVRADREPDETAAEMAAAAEAPVEETAAAAGDDGGADTGADAAADAAPAAATTVATAEAASDAEFRFAYVGDLTSVSGDLLEALELYAEIYSGDIPLPIDQAADYFADVDQAVCSEDAFEMVTEPDAPALAIVSAGFGRWDGQPAEFYEFLREDDQIVAVLLVDDCAVLATQVR